MKLCVDGENWFFYTFVSFLFFLRRMRLWLWSVCFLGFSGMENRFGRVRSNENALIGVKCEIFDVSGDFEVSVKMVGVAFLGGRGIGKVSSWGCFDFVLGRNCDWTFEIAIYAGSMLLCVIVGGW